MTTQQGATIQQLAAASPGVGGIYFPKKIIVMDKLPALATGKVDYPAVTRLVLERLQ